MSNSSILWSPAPYHIISYGTLLGASFYQSFINGIVSYRALPRPQFSILQEKLTPVYFSLQSALPVIMALTYPAPPATLSPLGAASTISSSSSSSLSSSSGIVGFFESQNRWTVALPIGLMFCCNVANLLVLGPTTTRIMKERKHQETRDGKKSYDDGPKSQDMERLNRSFGMWHGASALVNLLGLGVGIWYAFLLAERIV